MSRPLVTVKTLIAMSREQGEIVLSDEAIITPAAQDWLHGTRVPVRRVNGNVDPAPNHTTHFLIGDAGNPYLQTLVPNIERQHPGVQFRSCDNRRDCLLAAIADMCASLAQCSDRRGAIVVENGAIASCVANKYRHVRAAILVRPSDLFALQRSLGVNVLVLEMSQVSLHQAQAAIDALFAGKCGLDPLVADAINGVPVTQQIASPTSCSAGG